MTAKVKKSKPLFIDWCPKDAIDGMLQMDIYEEVAYRRILDLIICAKNRLEDDDERLGMMTKVGTERWRKIRAKLLDDTYEDAKLYLHREGLLTFVRNTRCDTEYEAAVARIAKSSSGGKAKAEKAKSRENNKTGSAQADHQAPAQDAAQTPAPALPTIQPSSHEDSPSEANASEPPQGGNAGTGLPVPAQGGFFEEPPQPETGNARGTRLPTDWKPSPDDDLWARQQGLDERTVAAVGEQFRDYWIAASGRTAAKRDWPATWRNWIREHIRRNGTRPWPGDGRGPAGTNRASSGGAVAAARALLDQAPAAPDRDGGDGLESNDRRLRLVN